MTTIRTLAAATHRWLQASSVRRARRLALSDLLSMNAARLDDLGLNRHDVIEAIAASHRAEPNLDARRERNVAQKLAFGAR